MKSTKIIAGALLLTMLSLKAFSGNEGSGGGGGICTPKSCMTLAQAGLRIDDKETAYFHLEQALVDEVDSVINSLEVDFDKKAFIAEVIGDNSTFAVVAGTEVKRFNKFKKEYLSIVKDSEINASQFQLLAVSQSGRTFLLPGFQKLDTRGKALLLIHERLIRFGVPVLTALKFDGLLLDYLEFSETKSYDIWPLISAMYEVKILRGSTGTTGTEMSEEYIKSALKRTGPYAFNQFCEKLEIHSYAERVEGCYITPQKALSLRSLHPSFVQKLSGQSFNYWLYTPSALMALEKELSKEQLVVVEKMVNACEKDPSLHDTLSVIDFRPWKNLNRLVRLNCKSL